jgi:translation elongation factor EF-G
MSLEGSLDKALTTGRWGYPLVGLGVRILGGEWCPKRTHPQTVVMLAIALQESVQREGCQLLEPVFSFRLEGSGQALEEEMRELIRKRARLTEQGQGWLEGVIPFAETLGYSRKARSRGLEIELKPSHYETVRGASAESLARPG